METNLTNDEDTTVIESDRIKSKDDDTEQSRTEHKELFEAQLEKTVENLKETSNEVPKETVANKIEDVVLVGNQSEEALETQSLIREKLETNEDMVDMVDNGINETQESSSSGDHEKEHSNAKHTESKAVEMQLENEASSARNLNGHAATSCITKQLDVDQFLVFVGQFGRIQIILQVMLCCIIIPSIYQTLVMTFVGNNPPWRCRRINTECNETGSFEVNHKFYDSRCTMVNRSSWEFTKPKQYSIVTEWDLVCEYKELSFLANSALFIGWAIGLTVAGAIADRFGRKSVLFPSIAVIMIGGFASAFASDIWLFFVFRLIIGLAESGVQLSVYIMATELVGPKYRALGGTMIWFMVAPALCLAAMKSWYLRDWRKLEMAVSAPYLFVLVFYKFVPESVRWLHVNDKLDKAMIVIRRVARINRRTMPNATLAPAKKLASHGIYLDLFRPWPVCKSTLIQCYAWVINGMVYFGISLASDDLGGNLHRDFVLTSLIEIPANTLVIIMSNRFGRKPTVICSMFVGGLACIGVGIIPHGTSLPQYIWSRVSLGMLGKLCVTVSMCTLFIWTVELFPTIIRSQGLGLMLIASRFGAAAAPWIAQWLKHVHVAAPFSVMGGLTIIASLICFQLEETNKKATREVLEETVSQKTDERNSELENTMTVGNKLKEDGLVFKKEDSHPTFIRSRSSSEFTIDNVDNTQL